MGLFPCQRLKHASRITHTDTQHGMFLEYLRGDFYRFGANPPRSRVVSLSPLSNRIERQIDTLMKDRTRFIRRTENPHAEHYGKEHRSASRTITHRCINDKCDKKGDLSQSSAVQKEIDKRAEHKQRDKYPISVALKFSKLLRQ